LSAAGGDSGLFNMSQLGLSMSMMIRTDLSRSTQPSMASAEPALGPQRRAAAQD